MASGSNSLYGRCRSCRADSWRPGRGRRPATRGAAPCSTLSHRCEQLLPGRRRRASSTAAGRSVTSSDIRASAYGDGGGAVPLLVRLGHLGDLGLDGDPAGGERVAQVLVDADDLAGLAVRARLHPDAPGALQLLLGDPFGEMASGLLVPEQPVSVQGPPDHALFAGDRVDVDGLDLVQHGSVDVELGVVVRDVCWPKAATMNRARLDVPAGGPALDLLAVVAGRV